MQFTGIVIYLYFPGNNKLQETWSSLWFRHNGRRFGSQSEPNYLVSLIKSSGINQHCSFLIYYLLSLSH